MLHPSLRDQTRVEELRQAWSSERSIRIAPFLDEAVAENLYSELRQQAFTFRAAEPSRFNFQFWELEAAPHQLCEHTRCRVARWLWTEAKDWLAELTEMALAPAPDNMLVATHYDKGCYLDPHSDSDGSRQLAFILGLTQQPRSIEAGGHLEFLRMHEGALEIHERRLAGWNSFDIFDVTEHDRVHRVSLVTEPSQRRALSGWYWQPDQG